MIPIPLILNIALIINVFIGAALYTQRRGRVVFQNYVAYMLALLWWQVCDLSLALPFLNPHALTIAHLASIGWLGVAPLFLKFVYVILKRKTDFWLQLSRAVFFIAVMVSLFTDQIILESTPYTNVVLGPLQLPFTMFAVTLPILYGVWLVGQGKRKTQDPDTAQQLSLVFIGTILALMLGVITGVILPNFFHRSEAVFLASLSSTVQSIFIYYAVIRHSFMAMNLEDAAYSMFSHSNDGALFLSEKGQVMAVNENVKQWFGVHDLDSQPVYIYDILFPLPFPIEGEQEFRKENGHGKQVFSVSQFKAVGEYLHHDGWIVLLKDITLRVQVEEELEEQRNTLQIILNHLPIGIWMIDRELRFQFANPSLLENLSSPAAQQNLILKDIKAYEDFLFSEEIQQAIDSDQICFQHGVFHGKESYTVSDGSKHIFDITKSVVHDTSGKIQGLIGIAFDITTQLQLREERNNLQKQAEQTQRLEALGRISEGIAHDFNNLLGVIAANTSILEEELEEELEENNLEKVLERIRSSTERAAGLCDQMSNYAGSKKASTYPTNISVLLKRLMPFLNKFHESETPIKYEITKDLPLIEIDFGQFQQLLMDLIMNAVESVKDNNGSVLIRTGLCALEQRDIPHYSGFQISPGSYVFLEVSDTGVGIRAEILSRIFDPFFSTKFIGRGMGLSNILGIIKSHKGGIYVRSEVEKGTSFKLVFPYTADTKTSAPRVKKETERPPTQKTGSASSKDLTHILVVDDEEGISSLAQRLLQKMGFQTFAASNGKDAVQVFEQHHESIAAVLLDVMMPGGISGVEVFDALRKINPEIRVVFSSGYTEKNVDLPESEHTSFIQKPYTTSALRQMFQAQA